MAQFLVTGVAGFIGSHIARKLLELKHTVIGIDDLSTGNISNIPKGVDFLKIDLSDNYQVSKIKLKGYKTLHLAGQSSGEISFDNPTEDLKKNTISTLNLIKHGIENQSERIIFASSMSVYGNTNEIAVDESHPTLPLSCYGVGKLASENYLRIFSNLIPFLSLRMFNVYGEGQDLTNLRQGMVSIFISQAIAKKEIMVKGNLERFRDFIYIDDVVNCWINACFVDSMQLNQTINIGTGTKTTIKFLLDIICDFIPNTKYYVKGSTPGDQSGIYSDNTLMKKTLYSGEITNLSKGLKKFIEASNI